MSPTDQRQPSSIEADLLVPLSKRRTLSVAAHEEWRDWIHGGPSQTRKECEVARLDALLDEIANEERRSA